MLFNIQNVDTFYFLDFEKSDHLLKVNLVFICLLLTISKELTFIKIIFFKTKNISLISFDHFYEKEEYQFF